VGEGAVESIIASRERDGRFVSFFDFCRRSDLHKVNKRVLEGLIKAGAFDSTGARRAQLMAVLDEAVDEAGAAQRAQERGQTSIFGGWEQDRDQAAAEDGSARLPDVPEWDHQTLLKYERELTGFYITAHPLAPHAAAIREFSTASTQTLSEHGDGKEVKLCGIVAAVRTMTTKKGDRMAYFQLEDLQGLVEVIAFPDLYRTAVALLTPEHLIQVTGTIDRTEKGTRLKGLRIESLMNLQAKGVSRVTIRLTDGPEALARLGELQEIIRRHPGPAAVSLTFRLPSVEADTGALPRLGVLPSETFVADVEQVLGKGAVGLEGVAK
jgi:DNA polymerase-3 subunit alpha